VTVHVETLGSGPDLVLVHGWSMHGAVCRGLADRLAQHYRVHVPDLPGHGRSRGEALPDLRGIAAQLATLVPTPTHVCGWSLGAQIAMRWAIDQPTTVRRIALIAATPRFASEDGWEAGAAMGNLEAFACSLRADYRGTLDGFIALQALGSPKPKQVAAEVRRRLARAAAPDPGALEAGLRILATADLRAEVGRMPQHTLVVQGGRDAVVPEAAAAWLARSLPRGRLMVIPDAGHAPFVSHEAECADALSKHFSD
jgi:pimeloyl-[acyl-carrier protein] methyl ester esterase